MKSKKVKLTIVVLPPNERMELQYTLNSIVRSLSMLPETVSPEIALISETDIAAHTYRGHSVAVHTLRNISDITVAMSGYVCVVPPYTLLSATWISRSLEIMQADAIQYIARPELCISWNTMSEPMILAQGQPWPILYNVLQPVKSGAVILSAALFADSIKQASRAEQIDTQLKTGALWLGKPSLIIEGSAVFMQPDATVDRMDYASLPQFSFPLARDTKLLFKDYPPTPAPRRQGSTRSRTLAIGRRVAKSSLRRLHLIELAKQFLARTEKRPDPVEASSLPEWLVKEWRNLNRIDNRLFPSNYLLTHGQILTEPPSTDQQAASMYARLAGQLKHEKYDYLLFGPWLIRGGADKFTIEYANTISRLRPDLRVLVVTTLEHPSEWSSKLDAAVGYCDFGNLGIPEYLRMTLMEQLISQSGARAMHVINSELAYDFVAAHKDWLKDRSIAVAATSFSQEVGPEGRILGYSHSHLPEICESATVITSDNQAVAQMWQTDYGFDAKKIFVHHLPVFSAPSTTKPAADEPSGKSMRVLWASRLSTEKLPTIVGDIGKMLPDSVKIDMFGAKTPHFDTRFLEHLPSNVHYRGAFDGLHTLPLQDYDAFLYTSSFDGMPNTLLEIGLAGLPIVSSAVGGIPELIRQKQTGLLVYDVNDPSAYAESLLALRDNPSQTKQFAHNLQQEIRRDYSQDQFEAAISEMLAQLNLNISKES